MLVMVEDVLRGVWVDIAARLASPSCKDRPAIIFATFKGRR